MRPIILVPGIVILVTGLVWALQGAGLLPTSFMIGVPWIVIGAVVAVLGLAVALVGIFR